MIFGENAMRVAGRQLDLALVPTSPWTATRLQAMLAPRLSWRRVARELCLLFALVSFAVMIVALRLSLYGAAVVSSSVAFPATLATAALGVLLLIAREQLADPSAQQR